MKRREKELAEKALVEEQNRPQTAEEQAAEKLRLLQLQKEADLETARQLFGGLWVHACNQGLAADGKEFGY